jgi:hypothetical protein
MCRWLAAAAAWGRLERVTCCARVVAIYWQLRGITLGRQATAFCGLLLLPPNAVVVLSLDDVPAPGDTTDSTLCARARALLARGSSSSDWCTSATAAAPNLLCRVPPSRRAALRIVVVAVALTSCPASGTQRVLYDPPVLQRARIARLPTTGGAVALVDGANLEHDATILLGGVRCDTLIINASLARIMTPVGAGALVAAATDSTAYGTLAQPLTLGYAPPLITRVTAHGADTRGGYNVSIAGSDLGPAPLVWVGAAAARVLAVSETHTYLTVAAPAGVGGGLPVIVNVSGQATRMDAAFSYAPPVVLSARSAAPPLVTGLNSSYVDALRGGPVSVTGAQFGCAVPVSVLLDTRNCTGAVVTLPEAAIVCQAPPALLVSFTGNVSVRIGGQMGSWGHVVVACPPGWFGRDGEYCVACPTGGYCGGGSHEPVPAAGWTRLARADFVTCVPPGACAYVPPEQVEARLRAGEGEAAAYYNCAPSYSGELCAQCRDGSYRRDLECVPCPS